MSSTATATTTGGTPPPGGGGPTHPIAWFAHRANQVLDTIAETPAWSMTPAEQATALVDLERLRRRTEEVHLRLLASADDNDLGRDDAAPNTAAWLAFRTHTERRLTRSAVALAHDLDKRFDLVRRAFAVGELCEAQARVIIAAIDALPEEIGTEERRRAEEHLVAEARTHDAKELHRIGRHLLEVIAPDEADRLIEEKLRAEERAAMRAAFLTMRDNGHGAVEGRFKLPAYQAAMLRKAIDAIASPRRPDNQPGASEEPSAGVGAVSGSRSERWGIAFGELLERISRRDLPKYGGTGATVVVTMSLEQLQGGLGAAQLDVGGEISAGEARRLACNAGIIPAVLGGKSQPLDIGRTRRFHTEAQRTAIVLRDRTCTVEGCGLPAGFCDVHHDDPWYLGGVTSVEKGRLLCSWHHHRIHDPDYRVQRLDNNRLRLTRRT